MFSVSCLWSYRGSLPGPIPNVFSSEGTRLIVNEWLRIRPSWAKVNLRRILADLFLPWWPLSNPPSVWKGPRGDILLKLYWLWLWWLQALSEGSSRIIWGFQEHLSSKIFGLVFGRGENKIESLKKSSEEASRIVWRVFQRHRSSRIFYWIFGGGGNRIELGPRTSVSN